MSSETIVTIILSIGSLIGAIAIAAKYIKRVECCGCSCEQYIKSARSNKNESKEESKSKEDKNKNEGNKNESDDQKKNTGEQSV